MNTATADGSRALYGISQDGMTIKLAGQAQPLPRARQRHDSGRAPEHPAAVTYASDPVGALKILVFSNLGYVLCHVLAMSGFMLLRRDRPGWPRPISARPIWAGSAGSCSCST